MKNFKKLTNGFLASALSLGLFVPSISANNQPNPVVKQQNTNLKSSSKNKKKQSPKNKINTKKCVAIGVPVSIIGIVGLKYLYNYMSSHSTFPTNDYLRSTEFGKELCDIKEKVLRQNKSVNQLSPKGYTALMGAAAYGEDANVKKLLNMGENINTTTKIGESALSLAIEHKHIKTAKLLLNKCRKINIPILNGALRIAVKNNNPELVRLLLDRGAQLGSQAARAGCGCPDGPALKYAKTSQMVELLVHAGANVNDKADDYHSTSILLAICSGNDPINLDVLEALLKAGANANERDISSGSYRSPNNDPTPLIYLVCRRMYHENDVIEERLRAAKLLLQYDADVNLKDKEGRTALDYAAQLGEVEMVRILAKAKNITAETKQAASSYAEKFTKRTPLWQQPMSPDELRQIKAILQ